MTSIGTETPCPQLPLLATVTSRVGSSRWTSACIVAAIRSPFSFPSMPHSSFPMDHKYDAGMVAVATDHSFKLAQLRWGSAHCPVLVNDKHSQSVTGVEQLRRRRIVRAAISIATHFFEPCNAIFLQSIRDRHSHARVVLVIVRAEEPHMLAVKKEPLIWVKSNCANAKGRLVPVDYLVAVVNGSQNTIEVGRFE